MFNKNYASLLAVLLMLQTGIAQTPVLTMKEALNTALSNYGSIRAKNNYLNASKTAVAQVKKDYLPNLVLSAQQDYGTINGQNGPLYGFGGFGVASSGLPLSEQNWDAAFGALYLAHVNWEVFTFGRQKSRTELAQSVIRRDEKDLQQEVFQHQIRVAGAYLNLLAFQRLTRSQERNLDRTLVFKSNAVSRAINGLIPGVDTSLANAEVSNARIALTKARDAEQEQANKLAVLLGVSPVDFVLDTAFISRIPPGIAATEPASAAHPVLEYYKSRIAVANQQAALLKRTVLPSVSLAGIVQGRASGFAPEYLQDQSAYSRSYLTGIRPTRMNYLLGIGLNWNLTTYTRVKPQLQAQQFIAGALENEYELADRQIKAQAELADRKIRNAIDNFNEAPVQVRSATDAYLQRNALYQNGLTTLVEVTQTLYALNRAETDRDVAFTNVWQALLLKAAATGDWDLFIRAF